MCYLYSTVNHSIKCLLFEQAAADAKYYGNVEIYNILKARGAKTPVRDVLFSGFLFKVNAFLIICVNAFSMFPENQEDANGCCKSSRSSRV